MNIVEKFKDNLISNIATVVAAFAALVAVITYPVSVAGTDAYFALITVLTVLGLAVSALSLFVELKGYGPVAGILFYGLAFGLFLVSRMEAFGMLQVGIGTFGNMGAYVATIIFYGISLVSCLVGAFFAKKDV